MTSSTKNSLWLINLGKARGTPVLMHASFVLLLVWLLFVEAWAPQETFSATLFLLSYLTALALHEFSHLAAALFYKIAVSHITLLPCGSIMLFSREAALDKRIAISAAGPLANLSAAFVLLWISGISQPELLFVPESFLEASISANILLGGINLLPVFPLDGWKIGRLMFERSGTKGGIHALSRAGYAVALALLALSITFSAPALAVVAILCGLSTMRESFRSRTSVAANSLLVREVMIQRGQLTLLPHSITISNAMDTVVKSFQQYFPVIHNDEALGLVVRDNFLNALASGQEDDYISHIMVRDCPRIHTEDSLRPIIEEAFEDGHEVFIVLDGQERFAGLLVKNQVIELLLLSSIFDRSKGQELPDEFWL